MHNIMDEETNEITMPPLDKLLHSERDNLRTMLKTLDGEMLQAVVRRESICAVLEAVDLRIENLGEEIPEPNKVTLPSQLEFDFGDSEQEKAETAS